MIAIFTIIDRLRDGKKHVLLAEEHIQLSKECSFQACTTMATLREGEHEDQIELIIRFQHRHEHERIRPAP
jgi:hypothetical protein